MNRIALRIIKLTAIFVFFAIMELSASGFIQKGSLFKIHNISNAVDIKLKILDENGLPLPNATIRIKKNSNISYLSNPNGELELKNMSYGDILLISYLGYKTREIAVSSINGSLEVRLEPNNHTLREVQIVNTGYQKIPKERATGSFELIDSTLVNRVTSTNFINRLEGISPALSFITKSPNSPKAENRIRIRTESSIVGLNPPLIVVDNFPYDGNLENINPNDIENITLLKDAAAASIWGIRASRGVIVITTKKGKQNQPLRIDFNTNVTIGAKPDLYAKRQANPSDYISLEQIFFDQGKYDLNLDPTNDNSPRSVSPAVKIMYQLREGEIDSITAKNSLSALASHDVREDFLKYVYRYSVNQQYSLNLNGGGDKVTYSLSTGYDKNLNNLRGSDYERITLRSNTLFKPVDKLEIQTGLSFAMGTNTDVGAGSLDYEGFKDFYSGRPYIYLRLADDSGNPLVYDEYAERKSWLNGLGSGITNGSLLSWDYNPLAQNGATTFTDVSQDISFNVGAKYLISSAFSAELNYQYQKIDEDLKTLRGLGSYYTRYLINYFTSWSDGILKRNVPLGDIVDYVYNRSVGNTFRGQLNFNKSWNNDKHQLNAIVGVERRQLDYNKEGNRKFGYDQKTLAFKPVNLDSSYVLLDGRHGSSYIESGDYKTYDGTLTRSASAYANATYTYLNRYSLSGSLRSDASNVLGVGTNNRWQPLWSTGIAWNISREGFYKWQAVPELKLRTTYGYNGNFNNGIASALAVIAYSGVNQLTGLSQAAIVSPPNPNLSFERVGQLNMALDFSSRNQRISGTIEGYVKYGSKLFSSAPVDPTSGFSSLVINSANTKGKGVEITLNTINLQSLAFRWNTTALFTYNRSIVTRNLGTTVILSQLLGNSQTNPVVGKDAASVYGLKFAGLDPETGDPMGYVNGESSKDYAKLLSPTPLSADSLRYFGSAYPVYSSVLRNTFTYKGLSLSVTISGKFDYFFRKRGVSYPNFVDGGESSSDFSKRWQKPGDEKITNIPSPSDNPLRDQFYRYSEALVLPGDHIRIQDVVLNYNLPVKFQHLKNVRLYANVMNMNVIVWRKNKEGIDPDFQNFIPEPRTLAIGVSANF